MIVCFSHGFIFIKTRKTAGTSLEIALSRVCRDGDIITPLSRSWGEEDLRRRENGHGPCNWKKPLTRYTGKDWLRLYRIRKFAPKFIQHSRALDVKAALGEEVWSRSFKFAVERNPWDRAVSRYWWEKFRWESRCDKPFPGITECLKHYAEHTPKFLSNWDHYAIDGKVVMDRMLFYETLSLDLANLKREIGIEGDISLPVERVKGNKRHDSRHYSEILGDEDRDLIARVCRREIEAFGYEFQERCNRGTARRQRL